MVDDLRYLLQQETTLVVRGPASLRLIAGEALILGGRIQRDRSFVVRPERQLPVEAEGEAQLEINLGKPGEIFEIDGSSIPESWKLAREALTEMERGKVVVLGATDVGKSTLCAYLVNTLTARGLRLRMVDGDLGQADIGPPTTIASSLPVSPITSLVDLNPETIEFLGNTSPSGIEDKVIYALRELSERNGSLLTIINSDGWIADPEAISYKIKLIAELEPDLVVALTTGSELQPILSGSRARALHVGAAQEALARSRSDRRAIRTASYRRFLEGAKTRSLALQTVAISTPRGFPGMDPLSRRKLEGLIVGLLNDSGYLLHIGIFMGISKDTVSVYSRSIEGVRTIEVGYVKLSLDGREIGYFES